MEGKSVLLFWFSGLQYEKKQKQDGRVFYIFGLGFSLID